MATSNTSKPAAARAPKTATVSGASLSFPNALAAAPRPTNTREQILHAAVDVLTAEGFGALTQAHVAARAGVRQSHITYYFPSRNDLLREAATYGCNALLGALAGGIESGALTLANFRAVMTADIHDRRFARLMCALIVASDEDQSIKPWLANFDKANIERLTKNFIQLGLPVTPDEVRLFHSAYVGALFLDLGEATPASSKRATRTLALAFDQMAALARQRIPAKKTPKISSKAKK